MNNMLNFKAPQQMAKFGFNNFQHMQQDHQPQNNMYKDPMTFRFNIDENMKKLDKLKSIVNSSKKP
jgi:hypothetical protein